MSDPSDGIPCRVTGMHSLFLDDRQGTDEERHVILCDLDPSPQSRDPFTDSRFRGDLRRAMRRFNVQDVYLFKTLKGMHVFSPCLVSRRQAERFEEDLEDYGSDGFHRFMCYKAGGSVLRVTAKPGEGKGQRYVGRVRLPPVPSPREWSWPHWRFMADLHDLPEPSSPTACNKATSHLRLETYDTWARPPAEAQEVLHAA